MSTFSVIAKAGGSGEAPENTCAALVAASRASLPSWARLVLEIDVRFSADGVAMALHDARLERATNGVGRVNQLCATELQRLRVGGSAEPVATLRDAVIATGNHELVLDLHDESKDAAPLLIQELGRIPGAAERVIVASEHSAQITRVRALAPGLRTAASPRQAWQKLACDALGLSQFSPRGCTWMVPEQHRGLTIVTPRFVDSARRRGDDVWVYVVDDVHRAERLRKLGVSGCFTTKPCALGWGLARLEQA